MTFVGGYLGAGKTTVINELLANSDRPIAVIVNDVGAINIDASLIRKRHGDTIELTDGCICCSSLDGMGAALDQIRARPKPPGHVVVELSGVAEPTRMLPWGQSAGFMLDGVVVVVAADQLAIHEPSEAAPASSTSSASSAPTIRQLVDGYIRAHIEAADLLILTKGDLVSADLAGNARQALTNLAPQTPVLDNSRALSMPGAIGRFLALGGRHPDSPVALPPATLFDLHQTRATSAPPPGSTMDLENWIRVVPEWIDGTLVRAKGVIQTNDAGLVLLQVVGRRIEISRLPPTEMHFATDIVIISLKANDNTLFHTPFHAPSAHPSNE